MKTSRRSFTGFFIGLGSYALAVSAGIVPFVQRAVAQGLALIDMSMKKRKDEANTKAVDAAKKLNYVEDLEAALKAGKIKKKDMKTADGRTFAGNRQRCDNCLYFDLQKKKEDTCALIPGVLVHKPGSCDQWQPEQKT